LFWARQTPPPPPVGQRPFIYEVSRSHTTTHHSRQDSNGRVNSPSQRPLPDNTRHWKQTSMSPVGFEPAISRSDWPQTDALDRAATGICSLIWFRNIKPRYQVTLVQAPQTLMAWTSAKSAKDGDSKGGKVMKNDECFTWGSGRSSSGCVSMYCPEICLERLTRKIMQMVHRIAHRHHQGVLCFKNVIRNSRFTCKWSFAYTRTVLPSLQRFSQKSK